MRLQSFLAMALLPAAACGGGGGGDNPTDDAAVIDAPPGQDTPDAKPGEDPPDAGTVPACSPVVNGTRIGLQTVVSASADLSVPVLVTSPPGDPRLFIVERRGRIRIFENGQLQTAENAFLNISAKLNGGTGGGDERGLLGLAFHPNFSSNKKFYVFYTTVARNGDQNGRDIVAEYTVSDNPNRANTTERPLLSIPDPETNHNGGMIEFGPDGKLWVGTGDGGGGGDNHGPIGNAQNDDSLLGKMLRIDVNAANPEPEIWAKGLRNPWRWSFDTKTNDLYIGDVGQERFEEIDVVATNRSGLNFGWKVFEGNKSFPPRDDDEPQNDPTGMTFPVTTKSRDGDNWRAIVGGQVYRGTCFPDIDGWYFYTDYNDGELWKFRWVNNAMVDNARVLTSANFVQHPTSIHAGSDGELYVTDENGQVSRIVVVP